MLRGFDERAAGTAGLRLAMPYIRLYQGRTFVIKVGGAAFSNPAQTRRVLEQVGILHQLGIRTVLVHGGGPQATELSSALGLPTIQVQGRRVTDAKTLEVATMTLNGLINTQLLATCRALDVPAVGLSGVDAGLIRATKRPPVFVEGEGRVDFGFVGDITAVDPTVLNHLLDARVLPVVSSLAADDKGGLLNINADTVASALAVALKAVKLVMMTGAPGILEQSGDAGSLISYIDLPGLERLREMGSVSGGMLPKVKAIREALQGGVSRAHVISHDVPDSLLTEIFTNEGSGTLVVRDIEALSTSEQLGQKGLS